MPERVLRLTLEAGQSLPVQHCWWVSEGYLRATDTTHQAEIITLGLWGPGEMVIPELLAPHAVALRALSTAQVHECHPNPSDRQRWAATHIQQLGKLLQLTRVRPAEARLLQLLIWLSERFGTVSNEGRTVPLEALNLTHQQLAEMASLSRVTVTKGLGLFRQQRWLLRLNDQELLSQACLNDHADGS